MQNVRKRISEINDDNTNQAQNALINMQNLTIIFWVGLYARTSISNNTEITASENNYKTV